MMKRIYLLLLLVTAQALVAQTADQNAIDSAKLFAFAPPNFTLDIHFTNSLDNPAGDLTAANVKLSSTPDTLDQPLQVKDVQPLPGSRRGAEISFGSQPPNNLTALQICFHQLTFRDSGGNQTVTEVCSPVQILNSANIAAEKSKLLDALKTVPKKSDEKNVFASGFVTTASSGSSGGLDLDLNSKDLSIPGMTAFLHTKKSSTAGGDPKNFESGVNFRSVYSFAGKDLDSLKQQISNLRHAANQGEIDAAGTEINNTTTRIQDKFLSNVIFDFAGKLEGGATDFNVANYVGEGQISIQSRTKRLFGSRNGYWRFRLVPAGAEGGGNVQNNVTAGSSGSSGEDQIARFKAGGNLTLFYDSPESPLPFKRIQLDLNTVQRFLFFKEAETLSANAIPILSDGHRPWYEAHLLIYLAEAQSGRYGFRLDYKNGSLPPNFAVTKSFQVGFVYETKDGEQTIPLVK